MYRHIEGAADASEMYRRLTAGAARIGGIDFGNTALDVGGRNGLYVPLIHALGPEWVTIVDPDTDQLQQAVGAGWLAPEDEVYDGTIEEYAAAGHGPVDSAFVFNILPELSGDTEFVDALVRVVRVGGWIVASMMAPPTSLQFCSIAELHYSGRLSKAGAAPAARTLPEPHSGPNCYIQLWRRERGTDGGNDENG